MPRNTDDAIRSATAAAAHLSRLLAELATAVGREDDAAIAQCARALVASPATRSVLPADSDRRSPGPHNQEGEGS